MLKELERFLVFMRPAFSRQSSFVWFVVVFVGFIGRSDVYGVSSIVRALWLVQNVIPACCIFFIRRHGMQKHS